jgi:hypothetical protein
MASLKLTKSETNINKQLDDLYAQNKEKIIEWLDKIKVYDFSKDNKIPGLLNKSKIQINTENANGVYNLILKWIKSNMDKFSNYDFTNIPNSNFISLTQNSKSPSSQIKKFSTVAEVEMWCRNSKIHPIKNTPMLTLNMEYYKIYDKAFLILKKNKVPYDYMKTILPKDYVLFGSIDILYYLCINKTYENIINEVYKFNKLELAVCKILTELFRTKLISSIRGYITLIGENSNMTKNEIALLKRSFFGRAYNTIIDFVDSLLLKLKISFFGNNYMNILDYSDKIKKIKEDNYIICYFIDFLDNNKFSDGTNIIDYLNIEYAKPNLPSDDWIMNIMKIYNSYKAIYNDINDCFNPASGIIENYEDKKLLPIKDPLDEFFEEFEKKLEEIKKPIYSQLIDLTTFKPKENLKYLNDAQYAEFKKERDRYDALWKKYQDTQKLYETTRQGSSPKPPVKPTITLPWGKVHTIAREIDPIHIKDEVIVKFREEYAKVEPIIDEYNILKNMSYKELKRRMGHSPTSAEMRLFDDNELLRMTKEEIVDNVLYDYSGLADKCSESIDILTNEELDDENYPLAKLQLMVRLKVYIPGSTKYRTECIYAPKLYNYLIKCINNKEYFVNPVTKTRYTEENIEELMKVMRIVDPKIERPVFVKHRNDRLLKLEYKVETINYNSLHNSFGNINSITYYKLYLSRTLGGVEYNIYNLCTIPAIIEIDGEFASGSADITSSTMLFRIYKLFNDGMLLYNYVPPYHYVSATQFLNHVFVKIFIHFNSFRTCKKWIKDDTTKEQFIAMFKRYAEEINSAIY